MRLLKVLLAVFPLAYPQGLNDSSSQTQVGIRNRQGFELLVAADDNDPVLRVILPGFPPSDRSIRVIFPEHLTALERGGSAAAQLYLFRPGRDRARPAWRMNENALEYGRALDRDVDLLARATLEEDGVRFRYEFMNRSARDYAMITAVTDPRLTSIFHDQRLERTFVHHSDGFDLIASETPERLTRRLEDWLPARYLASFAWPVPARRIERRNDGITYYTKSRAVDEPFIATRSTDGEWIVASVAREPGNVWSNPELTCQHVDPQTTLPAGGRAVVEIKLLIIRGSLDDALRRAREQRNSLK